MNDHVEGLERHYSSGDLLPRILAGLKALGKDLSALSYEDTAPADQFHTRGLAATRELAALAEMPRGARVLDAGSGLGGPARFLATEYGCDVTGVDLVPEFCAVANELSRLTGLAERSRFQVGSALELPFPDASFDLVWTFQVQMNIEDKARFYGELARVLRPGGRLTFQDIFKGAEGPVDYPQPWATRAEQSFLVPPAVPRGLLRGLGLSEHAWRDVTADTTAWRKAIVVGEELPPLGIHLVQGPTWRQKRLNANKATDAGRMVFIQAVFDKAA